MAVNYATQGLQLDPELADALATLALVYSVRYEYKKAQDAIDRYNQLVGQKVTSASIPWAYINLGKPQLAWDTILEFYKNDPLNMYAVGSVSQWAYMLKNDDQLAEYYESLAHELMGIPFNARVPEIRMKRVDVQTAVRDQRMLAPMFGINPDISDVVVPPVYDASLRESAAEELDQWYERGDIRLATYWAELIGLNRTDQVVNMSFDLFDQGVLNPVMFWSRQTGRMEFRNHPRFMELVEYIGLASYWDEVGWPGFCEKRDIGYFCGLEYHVD
jgi:hypothetical protein